MSSRLPQTRANTYQWTREAPLSGASCARGVEIWHCVRADATSRRYPVDVKVGKPFDVVGVKGADLGDIRQYAAFLKETAGRLYAPGSERDVVRCCPACDHDAAAATEAFRVFDVPYHRCGACGHGFVRSRPSQAALKALFSDSAEHSETYLDRDAAECRLQQIVLPKLDWVLEIYANVFGSHPGKAIDVGAGGGHFVAGLARAGIAAEGWELSSASRAFAKGVFGLDLRGDDFVASSTEPVDLVTYWGLLEYVPEPPSLLAAARKRLSPESGLLVVEVPRFDALGTVVQAMRGARVARHMDPTSHLNCFSDASLMTALTKSGFEPVAVWYFGMDVYELLIQLALRTGRDELLENCADMIAPLQACVDVGRHCDDLVVAARPVAEFAV